MKMIGQNDGEYVIQISPQCLSVLMNLALRYRQVVRKTNNLLNSIASTLGVDRASALGDDMSVREEIINPYLEELEAFRDKYGVL